MHGSWKRRARARPELVEGTLAPHSQGGFVTLFRQHPSHKTALQFLTVLSAELSWANPVAAALPIGKYAGERSGPTEPRSPAAAWRPALP